MPRKTFKILVEVLNCTDEKTAIATASAKLTYADRTDTVGYAPNISDVRTHFDGDVPISVELTARLQIHGDSHLKEFIDEMTELAPVMSVERA